MARIVQAVVQGNRQRRRIDKDEKGKDEETPATPAVVPCEWELWQEVRISIVVFLERGGATVVLGVRGGAGVVVCGCGWAKCVGETASRVVFVRRGDGGVGHGEGMIWWWERWW